MCIRDRVGFDLVAGWIESGVVAPTAVVTCKYADGSAVEFPVPSPYKSYTISSRDELLAFAPQDGSAVKETCLLYTSTSPSSKGG